MRRFYLLIFGSFFLFMLLLNIITLSAGSWGFFYVNERSKAALALMKHVVFESGVFLPEIASETIVEAAQTATKDTSVSPSLILLIAETSKGPYCIDYEGTMGLMRVKYPMLIKGQDPYILENNIKAAVTTLNSYIEKHGDIKLALEEYFRPTSRSASEKDKEKMRLLAGEIYYKYSQLGVSYE